MNPATIANVNIPPLDPFGIPAPAWVFVCLMNLTLVVHFLFLGYVFTTSLLAIFWSLAPAGSDAEWMLRKTERFLPVALSFAVSLGVAPLLFVQVLYPSYFYTSTILLGHQWFGIVPVVILAFYLIYILQGGELLGRPIPRACEAIGRVVIFLCILYVGVTHTTNALLSLHPDRWPEARAAGGTTLGVMHLLQPVFWPRLLHNLFALLAVGGVWLINRGVLIARRQGEGRAVLAARSLAKLGSLTALGALLMEMFFGMWLFVAESKEVQGVLFSARPAAMLWMTALAAGMGLMVLAALGMAQGLPAWLYHLTGTVLIVLLGGMFAGREAARQAWLAPYFNMGDWKLNLQVSSLILFLVALVAALVLVGMMGFWLRQAMLAKTPRYKAPAAEEVKV